MFTQNYYNMLNVFYTYLTRNIDPFMGSYSSPIPNHALVITPVSGSDYNLSPGTNQSQFAANALAYYVSNPYRDAYLHIGFASNEAEFNDLSEHPVSNLSVDNQGRSYNLSGTNDKKYIEFMFYMTRTNKSNNAISLNKLMLGGYMQNYWMQGTTGTTSILNNLLVPLITERFDPIIMVPNETRKFTYKIKYPMYY